MKMDETSDMKQALKSQCLQLKFFVCYFISSVVQGALWVIWLGFIFASFLNCRGTDTAIKITQMINAHLFSYNLLIVFGKLLSR